MNKKVKCKLIPLTEFYHIPPISYQDERYSYFTYTIESGVSKGKKHLTKIKRKNCCYCGSPAVWVGVFQFSGHRRAEALCKEHGSKFSDSTKGEIPLQKEFPQIKPEAAILNREYIFAVGKS